MRSWSTGAKRYLTGSLHSYPGGSYEQMDGAMASVAGWVRDNGYAFSGAAFLIYHVSPHETDNPEEYVTEICFPVEKNA